MRPTPAAVSIVVCLALAAAGCTTDHDGARDRAVEQVLAGANDAKAQLEDLVEAPDLPRGDGLLDAVRQEVPDDYGNVLTFSQDVVSDETVKVKVAFDGHDQSGSGGTYLDFTARVCVEFTVTTGMSPGLTTRDTACDQAYFDRTRWLGAAGEVVSIED
ncbi:hypothetical protein [Modestobacter sp. VKM Ac-2977]|uniref:hypothetical protein n=1 Tax=Modestobacter sp. VKM Ac-2977 TaxID=3004131 RepID=UPI0022AA3583|nr:hypothetical protein [Modestobacter sp. VKM Ac-2977]